MLNIKKFLLFSIIFAFLTSSFAAETIFVPKDSFLLEYDKDKSNLKIKAVVEQDSLGEVIRKENLFLPQGKIIGNYLKGYYLKFPGTNGVCYFPEVNFRRGSDGKLIRSIERKDSLMFLGILFFVIGVVFLAVYYHSKSEKKKFLLPVVLLAIWGGYAFWYIGLVSNTFIIPTDEVSYFNIAKKILSLDFTSEKFKYTAGFPLLCVPFISLFHLKDPLEFVLVYMNFQTFILIPGLLLTLLGFFHKKMGFSKNQSFSTLLLWMTLIIFYTPMCYETASMVQYQPGNYESNANFSLFEGNVGFLFNQFHWLGRNAMSDYIAFFLLVILLYVFMKKSHSWVRFFILSMGFGFLCCIRLNYIFFAPLLAFILYDSFSDFWKYKRNYLYAVLCGTAGFMIVFVWQLVLNKIQFGSPLIWPYSLHPFAPDRGFVWNVVPYGFNFLIQANYIYFVLGISSLLFIPERRTRVLLTLWIFPMFLFFTGYPIVFNNTIRFILALYPPLAASIVMNPVWKAAYLSIRIKSALVIFCACVLCKSNIFYTHFQPWNLGTCGISNNVFMVIQGAICLFCCILICSMRRELKKDYVNTIGHFYFLILFTAAFFLGSVCPYVLWGLISAALVYGLRDIRAEILQIMAKDDPQSVS